MLSTLRETARKGKQMIGVRELVLLGWVATCITAVEVMALAKGIDGVGLSAFFGGLGLIFGGAGVTLWKKVQSK